MCRFCGREQPDRYAIPQPEPAAVVLYQGRRYGLGKSRQPAAVCMWDTRDRSAPPVKTRPDTEQGWNDCWQAFTRKEFDWIDTTHPPRCPTCGSLAVAFISRDEAVWTWSAVKHSKRFVCTSCGFRW